MPLVLDASVTCAWIFDDEKSDACDELAIRMAEEGAYVPMLWRLEMANVLVQAHRRGRISAEDLTDAVGRVNRLNITVSPYEPGLERLTELSRKHGLTSYDALYLAHAISLALPLATLDEPLRRAAAAEAVPFLP
ncbi:MAG: type II toxin-antitoxin system VapC family toxin [Propionibacteriaceae bacterium]|jgi:predicted nucleic acid-binding protein|nr:type II toxin-antitoxin system VapC family toxin [Propionibacteriaceae bacterium]